MGSQSPVPSLHLGQHGADSAIPGLDIDPPSGPAQNGKPMQSQGNSERKEGVGGWISNLVKRGKGGDNQGASGNYKPVGQSDD